MEKTRFTVMTVDQETIILAVDILGKRESMTVDVQYVYKTLASYIGKLQNIFHSLGRDGEWDKRLGRLSSRPRKSSGG